MKFFLDALLEAVATLAFMAVPFIIGAVIDKQQRLKRRAKVKQIRRKHILAEHEDKCQYNMARRIWELEKIKSNQTITVKGYGAVKIAEMMKGENR